MKRSVNEQINQEKYKRRLQTAFKRVMKYYRYVPYKLSNLKLPAYNNPFYTHKNLPYA